MYSRSPVSLAALSTLVLSHASFAAPKPPQPGYTDPRILEAMRADQEQLTRFRMAGLTIPQVPSNGGRCVIDTSGHVGVPAGQPGMSDTYRLYEIQTWVVSPGQTPLTYDVSWNSVGNGIRHADNGVGTVNDWTFAIRAAANNAKLTARKIADGSWLIQLAQASMLNGVAVTQQQTISGRANPPGTLMGTDFAVGFPNMTFVPQPGSQPNTPVTVSQSFSWPVPQQINWGYPRPGYATGKITCTWNLSVGP